MSFLPLSRKNRSVFAFPSETVRRPRYPSEAGGPDRGGGFWSPKPISSWETEDPLCSTLTSARETTVRFDPEKHDTLFIIYELVLPWWENYLQFMNSGGFQAASKRSIP